MRPTFLAFQTAHRAIATSQILLDTAGNNIANVQTTGYSRQRVDINSVSNGGYIQRYKPQGVTAGGGVEAKRVTRMRDQFLDARYRMQNSEDSKYASILSGLNDIENVLDQVSAEGGLLAEIANFKKALDPMLENPPSNDMAMVVRNAAQKVASLLNTYSQHIENVRDQQIYDLQNVHIDTNFNSIVENIAALNKQINEEMAHGNTPNELLDERDLLFDKLSGLANIRVNISPKWLSSTLKVEHVEVFLVDDNTGKEIDLINDETYNTLSLVKNPDKTVSININSAFGNDNPRVRDATRYLTGGTIGGALNVINGKGAEFGSPLNEDNLFRGTLYYEGMLNTFAVNFAKTLNDINAYNPNGELPRSFNVSSMYLADGVTLNTNYDNTDPYYDPELDNNTTPPKPAGAAAFNLSKHTNMIADYASARRDLFETIDGSGVITAGNIKISQDWLDDPMRLTVTQPGDPSEGENIGRMIVAIEHGFAFYREGDSAKYPNALFNGTFEEYFTGVNATLGLDVSLYTNYSKTSEHVMTTLFTARESVSGVNLDEEGVALMAYQKSYNAAVRFFTVLDEAVDTIINSMGLVGR
ncbi:MAG: flagellar hook-associated protein FlgK [Clostridiales Family XIII bacterium]|jgi:flagellar hook-associated protein 1 FlgK|nr:flagellar hook-associated protein FlgK [Clostridiales Family XIII bacterium]